LPVDDHVVGVVRGDTREIRVQREAAGIEPQHLPALHRDHQHATVGQPAETGGLVVDDQLDAHVSIQPGRFHRTLIEIAEPEPFAVPARALPEIDAVEKDACVHVCPAPASR
jgi:hypothetical protein